ncbi:hypothetical protein L5515_010459 [Caenorhabditis briggsae]|uniref:glucuronosyltransferase n=1 Tax=Caenorhabditis briggsae TaxID=6238 RepID=A0AAE9EM52_CAEBR|nr:hypothetical protein L5515_010459 [Caenorhabditis briggsae]
MRLWIVPVLLACIGLAEPYKILMYTNLFGHSHIKMLGAVSDTLTDAGHDVTVLMPVIDFKQENKTEMKSTKKIIKVPPGQDTSTTIAAMEKFMTQMWTSDNSNPLFMAFHAPAMSAIFASQCRKVLEDKELLERLKAENFDLAITEPFDTCAYGLGKRRLSAVSQRSRKTAAKRSVFKTQPRRRSCCVCAN